jgi:hypothetical protein
MKDIPNAAWAASFICMAIIVAVIVLFSPAPENIKQNVLTLASSIVTGAFGYIQGKHDSSDSVTVPPNPGSSTTVSVIPSTPAEPAKL